MIVGAIPRARRPAIAVGDDRQVVLEVVGARILATRPLAHRSGRIDRPAHDRRPCAVAVVVVGAGRPAIVAQPERVAGLVRCRFAHRLGRLLVADVGEHIRRMVSVGAEHAQQRDADHAGTCEVRWGHHDALSVRRIGGRRPADAFQARFTGGDVDVERPIVLRHALPHLVDQRLLRGGEGAGDAVDVERGGIDDGMAHAAPRWVHGRVPVEIEVEDAARGRTRVQVEHVRRKRCGRQRGGRRRGRPFRRVRVANDPGVAEEHRRIVEEVAAKFVGVETDVVCHLIERARLLELLDRISSLRNIEVGPLERRWLLDGCGARRARGVIGLRGGERLRSTDDGETQRHGHDDGADPRSLVWPPNCHMGKVPERINDPLGRWTDRKRDSAGTDERSRHCTDCWD